MSLLTISIICTLTIFVPHMTNIKTTRDKKYHTLIGITQTVVTMAIICILIIAKFPHEINDELSSWVFFGFITSFIKTLELATETRARKPGLIISAIITIPTCLYSFLS